MDNQRKITFIFYISAAAAAASERGPFGQIRCQPEARSSKRPREVNLDWFYFFKQILFDQILNPSVRENNIRFLQLIQSHAQRGAPSASLQDNPYGGLILVAFQCFFNHFARLFSYFQHDNLLSYIPG